MSTEGGNSVNMGSKRLAPPRLSDDVPYKTWKNKLEMWKLVCGIDKKEQGIIVLLQSLNGCKKAEKAVSNLTAELLYVDDGLNVILEKLNAVFQSEEIEDAYFTYSKFSNFKRQQNTTMNDYIVEFENLHYKMDSHGMKLPDKVLAFKLLDGALVSENQRQMCLTLANDLTYVNMKGALKRIFGDKISSRGNEYDDNMIIKQEESAFIFEQNKKIRKNKLNPVDKQGKLTRCIICDSKMHWMKFCPHKSSAKPVNVVETVSDNDDNDDEEVNIILMTNEYEVLINEMEINAIIDTACTKTVAGENWFHNYLKNLDDTALDMVKTSPSQKTFKFGDGRKVCSKYQAVIPAKIGNINCFIQTEIVDEKIPLLLSKSSLKKAETLLNLKEDKVRMFNQDVKVNLSSNGHYAVEILPEEVCNFDNVECVLVFEENDNIKKKRSKLVKLHKQFGHASSNNLKNLMRKAGCLNDEISKLVSEICDNCDICKKYKKASPRPVVGLPRATDFNQSVAMDLHHIDKNLWYFHMIDEFSRYSNAVIIRSKNPSVIIDNFIQNWISLFGSPTKIFSDNGGEFVSKEFTDFCENFNIEISTTPGESPWSNGICERHNAILTELLLKIKEDTNCRWETAIAWAVGAKNAFVNVSGFSPHQLVFGKNINLPSSINDKLPAGYSENSIVIEHLNALHSSRQTFMKIESSNKLRKALQTKTRRTRDFFDIGQKVYYKRKNDIKWKGPGKVVGQDGPVVFVRHGGFYIKVHCSRVQLTSDDHITNDKIDNINQAIPTTANTEQNLNSGSSCEFYEETDVDDDMFPNTSPTFINGENNSSMSNSDLPTTPDKSENEHRNSDEPTPDCINDLSDRLSSISIDDNTSIINDSL